MSDWHGWVLTGAVVVLTGLVLWLIFQRDEKVAWVRHLQDVDNDHRDQLAVLADRVHALEDAQAYRDRTTQMALEPAESPQEPPEGPHPTTENPYARLQASREPLSGPRETIAVPLAAYKPPPVPGPATPRPEPLEDFTPDPDPPTQPAVERRGAGRWEEGPGGAFVYKSSERK